MFVLTYSLMKEPVNSIIVGVVIYTVVYLYFLLYSDYYPIFIKFLPYFIVVDLTTTGFLSYFIDHEEEQYIDMDEVSNDKDIDLLKNNMDSYEESDLYENQDNYAVRLDETELYEENEPILYKKEETKESFEESLEEKEDTLEESLEDESLEEKVDTLETFQKKEDTVETLQAVEKKTERKKRGPKPKKMVK